jgi:mannose-6-phosphate isomerase-like protein (cupin superfamily)
MRCMATRGPIVETLASGARLKWHLTAADTEGRLVRVEVWVPPGGGFPAPHVHDDVEERIELFAGTMAIRHGDERVDLTGGGRATVPAGVEHCWWNSGDDELHFMAELDPAPTWAPLLCLLGARPTSTKERK